MWKGKWYGMFVIMLWKLCLLLNKFLPRSSYLKNSHAILFASLEVESHKEIGRLIIPCTQNWGKRKSIRVFTALSWKAWSRTRETFYEPDCWNWDLLLYLFFHKEIHWKYFSFHLSNLRKLLVDCYLHFILWLFLTNEISNSFLIHLFLSILLLL